MAGIFETKEDVIIAIEDLQRKLIYFENRQNQLHQKIRALQDRALEWRK